MKSKTSAVLIVALFTLGGAQGLLKIDAAPAKTGETPDEGSLPLWLRELNSGMRSGNTVAVEKAIEGAPDDQQSRLTKFVLHPLQRFDSAYRLQQPDPTQPQNGSAGQPTLATGNQSHVHGDVLAKGIESLWNVNLYGEVLQMEAADFIPAHEGEELLVATTRGMVMISSLGEFLWSYHVGGPVLTFAYSELHKQGELEIVLGTGFGAEQPRVDILKASDGSRVWRRLVDYEVLAVGAVDPAPGSDVLVATQGNALRLANADGTTVSEVSFLLIETDIIDYPNFAVFGGIIDMDGDGNNDIVVDRLLSLAVISTHAVEVYSGANLALQSQFIRGAPPEGIFSLVIPTGMSVGMVDGQPKIAMTDEMFAVLVLLPFPVFHFRESLHVLAHSGQALLNVQLLVEERWPELPLSLFESPVIWEDAGTSTVSAFRTWAVSVEGVTDTLPANLASGVVSYTIAPGTQVKTGLLPDRVHNLDIALGSAQLVQLGLAKQNQETVGINFVVRHFQDEFYLQRAHYISGGVMIDLEPTRSLGIVNPFAGKFAVSGPGEIQIRTDPITPVSSRVDLGGDPVSWLLLDTDGDGLPQAIIGASSGRTYETKSLSANLKVRQLLPPGTPANLITGGLVNGTSIFVVGVKESVGFFFDENMVLNAIDSQARTIWSADVGSVLDIREVGDMNGDGFKDIFVQEGGDCCSPAPTYLLSGATGEMIWKLAELNYFGTNSFVEYPDDWYISKHGPLAFRRTSSNSGELIALTDGRTVTPKLSIASNAVCTYAGTPGFIQVVPVTRNSSVTSDIRVTPLVANGTEFSKALGAPEFTVCDMRQVAGSSEWIMQGLAGVGEDQRWRVVRFSTSETSLTVLSDTSSRAPGSGVVAWSYPKNLKVLPANGEVFVFVQDHAFKQNLTDFSTSAEFVYDGPAAIEGRMVDLDGDGVQEFIVETATGSFWAHSDSAATLAKFLELQSQGNDGLDGDLLKEKPKKSPSPVILVPIGLALAVLLRRKS